MKAVLLAADAPTTSFTTLALRLRWPDIEPVAVPTIAEWWDETAEQSADLVLLQANSQFMELAEAIEEVRWFTAAPLVVLGRRDDPMEVVTALSSGADDYIKLPCNLTELTVRIWAVMRRSAMTVSHEIEAPLLSGRLLLNVATHEAFLGAQPVHLTATEFRLLQILIRNSGSVVTHSALESKVWGEDTDSHGLVKKYVQRLRRKLGDDAKAPHWIACIHGVGYRFIGPSPSTRDTAVSFADETLPRPLAGTPA